MTADSEQAFHVEVRVFRLSMITALVMAIVGLTFAYLANSEVILLDGLFNVILFVMVAVGITIARRVNQGPDKSYHFGYGGYEPFLVLVRAALGLALMAFAAFGAVQTILRGGSQVNGNLALVYSIVLALSCGVVAFRIYRAYEATGWPTIYAEYITWLLNGVISGSTGTALFLASFLRGTSFDWLVPYADPILLLVMSIVLLPPPLGMLKQAFFELVGRAPDEPLESQLELERVLPHGFSPRVVRVVRLGKSESILFRVACDPQATVEQCDAIRQRWLQMARERFPYTYAVLVFSNVNDAA